MFISLTRSLFTISDQITGRSQRYTFQNICGTIHRNIRNKTRHGTRIKFYKTITIPTLIYASEAWVVTKKIESCNWSID